MYRSFLSWRYLHARPTNLIGVVGIFVAVTALILILSIMTGFLDQSKATVRGSLSDIIVKPGGGARVDGTSLPKGPEPALRAIRENDKVRAASARLTFFGIISGGGASDFIASNAQLSDQMGVRLYGVDVLTRERQAAQSLTVLWKQWFGLDIHPVLQDELDTTEFRKSLERSTRPEDAHLQVDDWRYPFAPPREYKPLGRPLASVVVGTQLAQAHYLLKGDIVTITTAVRNPETGDIGPANRDFVVAGTFRTGENEADSGLVYLERSELVDFLGRDREFNEILVQLHDYANDGVAVRDALRVDLDERGFIRGGIDALWEVRTWEEFRGTLLGAIENERVLMAIMLSLVLVVAGFTIFAILSMMVSEKRKDIGILCAIGATRRGVLQLFLMIAFWDALVGAGLGAIAGIWGALKIDAIERWLSSVFGVEIFNRNVYYFDHIPSRVDPTAVVAIVVGAFVCSLLFALIPAWRAARLDPLEALRYE